MKAFCQAEQCWVSWLYLIIVEAPDVKQGFALVTRVLCICSALSLAQHPQPGYRSIWSLLTSSCCEWGWQLILSALWTNTKAGFPASSFFFFSMGMKAYVWRDADYFQLFCWHVRMGPSWSAADIHHHWSLNPALRSQAMSSPWVWAPQTWEVENPDPKLEAVFHICLSSLCCVSNLCEHE